MPFDDSLRALALVCSLKSSPAKSSSELMAAQVLESLKERGVVGQLLRVIDYNVVPGTELDVSDADEWPAIRREIMKAQILILATPTWMGQHSSVCQRVLERLDAELSETDGEGRPFTYGKVATAVVVGNEDGAHHISGVLFQALNDVGFTIPAGGVTYWNGDAMHHRDYKDLKTKPKSVASTMSTMANNASHLARVLQSNPYPSGP